MTLDPTMLSAAAIGGMLGLLTVALLWLTSSGRKTEIKRRIDLVSGGARRRVPTAAIPKALPAAFARRSQSWLLGAWFYRRFAYKPWYQRSIGKLERAGVELAPEQILALTLALATGLAVMARLAAPRLGPLGTGLGLVAGPVVIWLWLKLRASRRLQKFLVGFPDALDLLTRGLRSGLPVAEVLGTIARELPEPVAGIFADLDANLRIGLPLGEALESVAETIDAQEFRFFAISLVLQQETGGNLAEILQNLSQLLRRRNQMQLKIKAMSSEARASAMIIGSLPFVTGAAIYVANPDYIERLFVDPRGWMMLGFAATSMLTGLGIMAKMVRFEV